MISDKLNTLCDCLTNFYSVAEMKGATIPEQKNIKNMAETIDSMEDEVYGIITGDIKYFYDLAGDIETLPSYAFAYCSALSVVSFPSCSCLGSSAFYNCISLDKVILATSLEDVPTLFSSVFANTPLTGSSYLGYYGSIYVPVDMVESFQTATNWAFYSDRITGIENL